MTSGGGLYIVGNFKYLELILTGIDSDWTETHRNITKPRRSRDQLLRILAREFSMLRVLG